MENLFDSSMILAFKLCKKANKYIKKYPSNPFDYFSLYIQILKMVCYDYIDEVNDPIKRTKFIKEYNSKYGARLLLAMALFL